MQMTNKWNIYTGEDHFKLVGQKKKSSWWFPSSSMDTVLPKGNSYTSKHISFPKHLKVHFVTPFPWKSCGEGKAVEKELLSSCHRFSMFCCGAIFARKNDKKAISFARTSNMPMPKNWNSRIWVHFQKIVSLDFPPSTPYLMAHCCSLFLGIIMLLSLAQSWWL